MLHGKNDLKRFKSLGKYRSDNFVGYQNSYVGNLSMRLQKILTN